MHCSKSQLLAGLAISLLLISSGYLSALPAEPAAVPGEIHYQGRLTGAEGNPTEGEVDVTVRLFNATTAGNLLYEEALGDVPVTHGMYQFSFGSQGAGLGEALNSPEVWLELEIDGEPLVPRSRLLTVPYAVRATHADTATTADSATTAEQVTGDIPGTFTWHTAVDGAPTQMQGGSGYLAHSNTENTQFFLPTDLAVGDTVRVSGVGGAGWRIMQGEGQRILIEDILSPDAADVLLPPNAWTVHFGDTGRSWSDVVLSADGKTILASVWGTSGTNRVLYLSKDGGQSWENRLSPAGWNAVAISADGQRMFAAGQSTLIHSSTDGGDTWTTSGSTLNWQALACSADGMHVVAAAASTSVGPSISTDGGQTWTTSGPSVIWRNVAISDDGQIILGSANNSLLQLSTNGGADLEWDSGHAYRLASGGGVWRRRHPGCRNADRSCCALI